MYNPLNTIIKTQISMQIIICNKNLLEFYLTMRIMKSMSLFNSYYSKIRMMILLISGYCLMPQLYRFGLVVGAIKTALNKQH